MQTTQKLASWKQKDSSSSIIYLPLSDRTIFVAKFEGWVDVSHTHGDLVSVGVANNISQITMLTDLPGDVRQHYKP